MNSVKYEIIGDQHGKYVWGIFYTSQQMTETLSDKLFMWKPISFVKNDDGNYLVLLESKTLSQA